MDVVWRGVQAMIVPALGPGSIGKVAPIAVVHQAKAKPLHHVGHSLLRDPDNWIATRLSRRSWLAGSA